MKFTNSAPPSIPSASKFAPAPAWPPAWMWFFDEALPDWVKSQYSPKESWKDKPFDKLDAEFFGRGVEELSELFTEDRSHTLPEYFAHPKFRSSYLLYFLPLQAAKFVTLFRLHSAAMAAAVAESKKSGVFRVYDLGAGPGTASIAVLLWLLQEKHRQDLEIPARIEFHWYDTSRGIMQDGAKLVELIGTQFPSLRGKVSVQTFEQPWWKATASIREQGSSLIFMGNVLNEGENPTRQSVEEGNAPRALATHLAPIIEKMGGGGLLMVEPAARQPAQTLSQIRDELFESHAIADKPAALWGPCLHAGRCPLATGRDWCHLSVPVEIPGRWFKSFSKQLGSERQWAKYAYLWVASPEYLAPNPRHDARRVISEALRSQRDAGDVVLLCEPEQALRWPLSRGRAVHRGDVIELKKTEPAGPLSGASGKDRLKRR